MWHSFSHIFWHSMWHIFWQSIWHIFWHSIWPLRSSGAHWARKVPGWGPAVPTGLGRSLVEVQRCPLRSEPCGWGPERLAKSWQGGSGRGSGGRGGGGEGGGRGGGGGEGGGGAGTAVIKSNNPHLAGGEILYFKRSPPWHYFVFSSHLKSIYGTYFLTVCSGILSDILFWHSILASYLASVLTSYLASFLASELTFSLAFYQAFILIFYLAFILTFFLASILAFRLTLFFSTKATWYMPYLTTFFLAYVSGISSDILSGILSGNLVYLRRFFVQVWRGTLWSGACGWGPASWACCSGPARNTAIYSLELRSGGDCFDPEVAVRVRCGTLWSRACSWGPAGGGGRRRRREAGQLT